jgi:CRISPR system Cascade subunit CasB
MSDQREKVARLAPAIAVALAAASPGERAAARRMDSRGSPLFWRVTARLRLSTHEEAAWLRLMRMIALLTPAAATGTIHDKDRKVGTVLADGGQAGARLEKPFLSEPRLARLLAARGEARLDALERSVRMIARARPKLDVVDLAWVVLRDDSGHLARDYYARLARNEPNAIEERENA